MEKLRIAIFLGVVVACFYIGWNMVPPYFHNYQFQDDLDDMVRRYSYLPKTDDEIKQVVITKAQTMDIKLKEDQIKVSRDGDGLGIIVHYRFHVDMAVHPVDLDFTASSMNKRL
jgi:hypothetical protein